MKVKALLSQSTRELITSGVREKKENNCWGGQLTRGDMGAENDVALAV